MISKCGLSSHRRSSTPEGDSLRHFHQWSSHRASWPSCSAPHLLAEKREVQPKLVALLSYHSQYYNHLLTPDSTFPPSLLFLLWTVWKKPFLLLSLAFSSKPQVISVLRPVFCSCSAFWGCPFQFSSLSMAEISVSHPDFTGLLLMRLIYSVDRHTLYNFRYLMGHIPFQFLVRSTHLFFLWITSSFPHINSLLLRSKVSSHWSSMFLCSFHFPALRQG